MLESKTMWTATAVGVIGAVIQFAPTVQEFIPSQYYGAGMMILSFVFAGLRAITTQPVGGAK